jgi:hypothetical protein
MKRVISVLVAVPVVLSVLCAITLAVEPGEPGESVVTGDPSKVNDKTVWI